MSLKDAQHKLSADIANLYETYQLISKNKQQFNDLDIALLQQQLLYIYHSLLKVQSQLGQLPEPASVLITGQEQQVVEEQGAADLFSTPQPEPVVEKPVAEDLKKEPVKEEPVAVEQTLVPTPVAEKAEEKPVQPEVVPEPEPVVPEPTLDDLEKLMREQEAKEEAQQTLPVKEENKSSEQTNEPAKTQLTEATLSLLDKLTANMRTPDVHEKISREQINLKQAINLNKKIAFVNNLFNENTVEYAKAIERLNSASTQHEALRYFSELKHQYNWNNENPLVKDLEQLVEKRYS